METILVERDEQLPGLVTITLNRPDKLNAISFRMHQEVQQACRELADDARARVVILTGAGRAFSRADVRRTTGGFGAANSSRTRSPNASGIAGTGPPRRC
jgi:enoyl-CoA hydratase/carnithine racemase